MQRQDRDLRDLVFGDSLGETSEAELQAISGHPERREELNRLLRLRETLATLGEEEPPRRIVLALPPQAAQPLPATQISWWQSLRASWGMPGWGFAGACALAGAIVFHAVWTPAVPAGESGSVQTAASSPAPSASEGQTAPALQAASLDEAKIQALLDARVDVAVRKVRAELETKHEQQTAKLVQAAETRLRATHEEEMTQVREAVYFMNKQLGRQLVATAAYASERQ